MKNKALKYYLSLFGQKWGMLISCVLASIVQSITLIGITWLVQRIFDDAIPQKDLRQLIQISLAIVGLYLINGALALGIRYFILKVSQGVSFLLKNRLVNKLLDLDKRSFESKDPGVLHTIIVQDTERLDIMTNALIAQLLPSLVISITICVGLLYINTLFFVMTILIVPVIVVLSQWLGRFVRRSALKMHKSFEVLSNTLYKIIAFWDQIYLFGTSKAVFDNQKNNHKTYSEHRLVGVWMQTAFTVMQDTLLAVGGIVMIVFGGYFVIQQRMTWGELFSFYVALALLKTYIYRIATNIPQVLEGFESLKTLYTFSLSPEKKYRGKTSIDFRGNIALEGVSFSYGSSDIIDRLSLNIQCGQCLLISGPNGAGKSTLINLILGLYYPSLGKLKAEGLDYKEVDLRCLLDNTGIVLQQPKMQDGSIKDNISKEHSLEEVKEACQLAIVSDIVQNKGGFDGVIRGNSSLSGGEIQRLAIARALVKRPQLLILDEPFNHLGLEVSTAILHNIQSLDYRPTVIIISHQDWVRKHCDQVLSL